MTVTTSILIYATPQIQRVILNHNPDWVPLDDTGEDCRADIVLTDVICGTAKGVRAFRSAGANGTFRYTYMLQTWSGEEVAALS